MELRLADAGAGFLAAEEAKASLRAEVLFLAVFLAKLSPFARDVTREETHRVLSAFFESGEDSWRSLLLLNLGFASEAPQRGAQERKLLHGRGAVCPSAPSRPQFVPSLSERKRRSIVKSRVFRIGLVNPMTPRSDSELRQRCDRPAGLSEI